MKLKKYLILSICLIFLAINAASAAPGGVDPLFLTGDGYDGAAVDADFQPDGKLIVVGKFTSIVGFPRQRLARLGADGNLDLTFNAGGSGANGDVLAVKVLADGKILIGGSFTSYNGTPVGRLARLNADGTLDATFNAGTGAASTVYRILVQPDNKILIAGGFSSVNGFASRVVARLLSDGAVDQSFVFTPELIFNEPVKALALQADGKILFGGNFFGGFDGVVSNIARLDASGNLDPTFQGRTNIGPNINTPVASIVVRPDGKILLGGNFSTVNGISKSNVALLNANGTLDNNFSATSVSFVNDLALLADGRIAVAGNVQITGQSLSMLVGLLNANGSPDNAFVPFEEYFSSVGNNVIITADGKILVCGLMSRTSTVFGGAAPTGVRRLNLDGTRDYGYRVKTGALSSVTFSSPVTLSNGKIVVNTGSEATAGGLARNGLARLNADGTVDEAFDPPLRGTAFVAAQDDSIILGGVYAEGRFYLRRINPDGSVDPNYSVETVVAQQGSLSSPVGDMARLPDGKILVAGSFTSIGGVARKSLARLNADGSVDASFNHNLTIDQGGFGRVVVQPDGKIWVSGQFGTNGVVRAVFRLNSSGTAETFTQVPNTTGSGISDISPLPDGKAYIGGGFTAVGQTPVKYVARLNQDGTVDTTFNPANITGANGEANVYAVYAQKDGKVIVGGNFYSVGGVSRRGFARLNADGSLDTSFTSLVNNTNSLAATVSSIVDQPDGKILLSGYFAEVSGLPKRGIARLLPVANAAPYDFDGDGKTDIGIFRASDGSWWYNRSGANDFRVFSFGVSTDVITPGDYTGDGKADIAVFRPSTGFWFVQRSEDNSFFSFPFGASGDIPAPADYDADGKMDAAVFRPSTGTWYISNSGGSGTSIVQFGSAEDKPVPADFDGDGKADVAIFRPSDGSWWYVRSSDQLFRVFRFGVGTDKPVQGDWTGDGKADIAVFRAETGIWFVQRSEDNSFFSFPFGGNGDIPAPGDYDGDGRFDPAVFRPTSADWFVNRTTAGILITNFGASGDRPIPNAFVP